MYILLRATSNLCEIRELKCYQKSILLKVGKGLPEIKSQILLVVNEQNGLE